MKTDYGDDKVINWWKIMFSFICINECGVTQSVMIKKEMTQN